MTNYRKLLFIKSCLGKDVGELAAIVGCQKQTMYAKLSEVRSTSDEDIRLLTKVMHQRMAEIRFFLISYP